MAMCHRSMVFQGFSPPSSGKSPLLWCLYKTYRLGCTFRMAVAAWWSQPQIQLPWNRCWLSFMEYMLLLCLVFGGIGTNYTIPPGRFDVYQGNPVTLSTTLYFPRLQDRTIPFQSIMSYKFLALKCFLWHLFHMLYPWHSYCIYICVEFMVNKRTPQV